MALDRQDIEKRDFPIGRRGYDPDAVDLHLREIAEEVEALRESAAAQPRGGASLAAVASDQVRAIVEAAESSAAGIQREAEERAAKISRSAAEEADRTRADAAHQAREHVVKVSEATAVMLQRVDAMESELGALVESLRTGANRLIADLALLQGNMGELRAASTGGAEAAAAPARAVVPEPVRELVREPEPEPYEEPEPEPHEAPEPAAEDGAAGAVEEKEPTVEEKEPTVAEPDAGADVEGARLIALNMALNGTPRAETERYLAENFDIPDRAALLDEVYSRVG